MLDYLSLSLLSRKWVANKTQLQCEVIWGGGMFEVSSLRVVQLDQLLYNVSKDVVFKWHVRHFEICLIEGYLDLGWGFAGWLTTFTSRGGDFNLRVKNFGEVDLVIANKCRRPLILIV